MAYSKTTWVNEGPPAIDADNLNNIEDGIANVDARVTNLEALTELVVSSVTVPFSQAQASQSTYTGTLSKPGYYPIGCVGHLMSGTGVGQIVPYSVYMSDRASGSCTVTVGIRNNNTGATITGSCIVRTLWQKEA